MFGALNFPALILELHDELRRQRHQDSNWLSRAHALAMRKIHEKIQDPLAFLDWAKRDRHWSYTLAEVLRDLTLRPAEVAARLMVAMVEQLEDELDSTSPEIDAAAAAGAVGSPAFARSAI